MAVAISQRRHSQHLTILDDRSVLDAGLSPQLGMGIEECRLSMDRQEVLWLDELEHFP